MTYHYSPRLKLRDFSLFLLIIIAALLSTTISIAHPLKAISISSTLPSSSKRNYNSNSKSTVLASVYPICNLSTAIAPSGKHETLNTEPKTRSFNISRSSSNKIDKLSNPDSPKSRLATETPSSTLPIPSFRTKYHLKSRQIVVMATSIAATTTIVIDTTLTAPFTSLPSFAASTTPPKTASTIASTLPGGGTPPTSGDGHHYISEDSRCGYNSSVRAICNGSEFGDCCSKAGFCGFDNSHCMDGCQSDFGTCGIAGLHLPFSSGSASLATSTTSSKTPSRTAVAIDLKIDYWTFKGCWTESVNDRALYSKKNANESMTLDICAALCKGFQLFGAEYGRECKSLLSFSRFSNITNVILGYCGDNLAADTMLAPVQQDCNFPCVGNKLQYCGGNKRLQLYTANSSSEAPTLPTVSNTNKSAGLGNYTSPQVVGMSIASIMGLLVFIFLGKYRRPLFARIANHHCRPVQPASPSIPMQNLNYVPNLPSKNTTPVNPSKRSESSKRSVNSSLYRFADDLPLASGGLEYAGSIQGWDQQQLKPPNDRRELPAKEVKVLEASETFENSAYRGSGSSSSPGAVVATNQRFLDAGKEATMIEHAEFEIEHVRQESIKHGLTPSKGPDIFKVLNGGPGWV